jgi:hypothetical protein
MEILLRRNNPSAVSPTEAVTMLQRIRDVRIVSQSGINLLADIDSSVLPTVQELLKGWIVSPQAERIPVPDSRLKIGPRTPR